MAIFCYYIITNMPEIEKRTLNNVEIAVPVDKLTAEQFRLRMGSEYGLEGANPKERTERLREMSVEGVAILLEDINKSVQGSGESLMNHDGAMKVGDTATLRPEDRYEVFLRLIEDIRACPDDTNPARIADTLALGVVLLHPFHDGSGRTARVVGLLFRDYYDTEDYSYVYNTVTQGRDEARAMSDEERQAAGVVVIPGYVPSMPAESQSDPSAVSAYLNDLLTKEESAYIGTFPDTKLKI